MARRNLRYVDASQHASQELEYLLDEEVKERAPMVPSIPVEQALRDSGVYEMVSERTATRVLFISRDEALLNPESQSLDGFLELSELFAEVHILVLRRGIKPPKPVLRARDNVWIYTASARYWWWTPFVAKQQIESQLVFAGGLRPDLIVARDPFESALVGWWISRRYARSVQVHVRENFFTQHWRDGDSHQWIRRRAAHFVLSRIRSVRTETEAIRGVLAQAYPTLTDLAILPRFRNYACLLKTPMTIDLKERFKPHIFFMTYIGALTHGSTVYRAIDAARFVLRNPRVCLLILGDGPARAEFQKRAAILGIDRQVIFATQVTDATAVLKSSNVLIVTDTDTDSDELALKAAALGVPMIMTKTPLREDAFVDGESAFLVEPTDVQELSNRVSDILNQVPLRRRFSEACQYMITERFVEDPLVYQTQFRESIEQAILADDVAPSNT